MNFKIRPLTMAAVAAVLLGLHPAQADSPTILMLNIDKGEVALKVVDNLNGGATAYSGTLKPGQESTAFKVRTQPGGTDFTWTATGKNDKGASVRRCGTIKDKNRGGRVDVLAVGTAKGETPVGSPC